MRIAWGETYRGPGAADPKKTRAQRERGLRHLVQTTAGREVIEYTFALSTGLLQGVLPLAGLLMIETILNHEYQR